MMPQKAKTLVGYWMSEGMHNFYLNNKDKPNSKLKRLALCSKTTSLIMCDRILNDRRVYDKDTDS